MSEGLDNILTVVHETAKGLYDTGIMNEMTMREFDALCLAPVKAYNPQEIKEIRMRNRVSQAVFAAECEQDIRGRLGVGWKKARPCGRQTPEPG